MAINLACLEERVDDLKYGAIASMLSSEPYKILKEVVASRCAKAQMQAMLFMPYPYNESANEKLTFALDQVVRLNAVLDVLEDLEQNRDGWFTTKIITQHTVKDPQLPLG